MRYLLGLDIGTTNIKALALNEAGGIEAYATVPTQSVHPRPEWTEYVPEQIWQAVCTCIREVGKQIDPARIVSVGISSMAETGVLTDAQGKPLYNFIAWHDFRCQPQSDKLVGRMGIFEIFRRTGQPASGKYGVTKLLWLKDNIPGIMEKARHWLSMEDYIIYRLSGEFATDYSIASRTMAFDINRKDWSAEILDAAELPVELFPKAYPGGAAVGKLCPAACDETGLSPETAVCTGGHDHSCAAVAMNILGEEIIMDSMGTAEASMIAVDAPVLTEETLRRSYAFYPHSGKRGYRVLTSGQCCGAAVEWYLKYFGAEILRRSEEKHTNRYAELIAAMAEHNGETPMFFPFLRGTVEQKGVSGLFWGLRDTHTDGDLIRALFEGLCLELKNQTMRYSILTDRVPEKLRVVGGLSRSDALMQLKADIQRAEVIVPENREAAGTGAALLGGLGIGLYDEEHVPVRLGDSHSFIPNPQTAETYGRLLDKYCAVRRHVFEICREVEQ